jgi:3-oxoacyl-[acyl-carrier-protein] synthase II
MSTSVVVTGLGATTPLGGDVASTWSALLAGRSGVKRLTAEWAESLSVQIAAPIAVEPSEVLPKHRLRRLDRCQQFALIAAHEAWRDAGFAFGDEAGFPVDGERVGAVVSSGIGGIITTLDNYDILNEKGWKRVSPFAVPMLMPNGAAGIVSIEFGAKAGAHALASACASSAEAIGYGIDMIRSGRADVVIAGGTEAAIHRLNLAAFGSMRAMSTRNDDPDHASRPYDRDRDGFVLGEGSWMFVVEEYEHARARGAKIYAEIAGYGSTCEAFHRVRLAECGEEPARAIQLAMKAAGIGAGDVDYVNLHGTSTELNDRIETRALKLALGEERARQVPMSALKSQIGHPQGACGAAGVAATLVAMRHEQLPPTINLDRPDAQCDLDYCPTPGRTKAIEHAVCNCIAFGSKNSALVLRRVV